MAEQAIGAIYALAKHPDVVCTEIIRRKTKAVFQYDRPVQLPPDPAEDQVMQEAGLSEGGEHDTLPDAPPPEAPPPEAPPPEAPHDLSFFPLSQLLFVVGHVASKFFEYSGTARAILTLQLNKLCTLSYWNWNSSVEKQSRRRVIHIAEVAIYYLTLPSKGIRDFEEEGGQRWTR